MKKNNHWAYALLAVFCTVISMNTLNASEWWEKVKVKGDLRYRHEIIKEEDKDARNRHRLRARLGITGEVSPYMTVTIQLATGSTDPVSTNQTLDDAFSTKNIGLDLAYFSFKHPSLPGLNVIGGKFKNPFFKPGESELMWDSDWNPEGGTMTYDYKVDNFELTLIGAGLWIDERSSSKDSYLAAGQGVGRINFNDSQSSFAVGGGYFGYGNTKGFEPFYDPEDGMGNSVIEITDGDETVLQYANEFEIVEVFAEATHKFNNIPVMVMGDYVNNTAADSLNTGWLVGLHVGKAKNTLSWALRYIYREVEQDAVVGIFADSDFRGGGTDAKGHEFGGSLQVAHNTTFSVSYFVNEIGLEREETEDFQRMQIDLQLKF